MFNQSPFPSGNPEPDTHVDAPADAPAQAPLGVPLDPAREAAPGNPAEFPPDSITRALPSEPKSYRHATLVTGTVLLSLLTTTAVIAAKEARDMDKSEKSKLEHGQGFENAHPYMDTEATREEREHAMAHPGKPHMGPPGHPEPPGYEGPNGKATFMNRKMRGHQFHADHPARMTKDAKHWQDKRMWRQAGNWQGADSWSNARAKDWKAERTTWPLRGGYGGAFIDQKEYDKHYSAAHDFRLGDEPKMRNGYAHFSHEGDQFVIVDPYPQNWNAKWHSSDDVYLEYNQGYYLINRQHPGSPLAVMVLE